MKYTVTGCLLVVLFLSTVVNGDDSWDDDEDKESVAVPDPVPVGGPNVKGAQIAIPSAQGPGGSSAHGSNYAGFNQKCALESEPGIRCNPNNGLTCDMRLCKCKNSTIESDLFYVYSPIGAKCFPVSRSAEKWACEYNLQCTASRQGKFSRCNYDNYRCECADTDDLGREIVLLDEVCYVKKEIGSQCQSDVECQVTIKGKAVCLGIKNQFGVCACAGGYSYDPLLQECLQTGTSEESNCKSDRQCDHETALGDLARCNPTTGKCQCWDTRNNGESQVDFYRLTNRCYYKRKENERCDIREECYLGIGRNADCLVHPAYNDEKVCQCPTGMTCGGSRVTVFSVLLLVLSAFLIKSL